MSKSKARSTKTSGRTKSKYQQKLAARGRTTVGMSSLEDLRSVQTGQSDLDLEVKIPNYPIPGRRK